MSQQYPHNPQNPNQPSQQSSWGAQPQSQQYSPPQAPYQPVPPYQPEPPKKKSWVARHKVLTVIGAVVAVFIIGGIASGGGEDTGSNTATAAPDKAADAKPADDAAKEKPADKPKKELSQAEEFKAFVAKNGTGPEKAAAKHVTKVQGADKQNDFLDAADVYTDYKGGIMSPNQGDAKLLASAFADWKDSENGLVTVYDAAGELMANGNF
ncbi:hypothetical protein [Streptomyces sp. NPDC060366]|uniref:hypothetical protein n=1 Tax=Streptomyces sp. NPDC060366 TaxID=3347105 RepID=UPI00364E355D